jgi:dephospho-CoA kinase
MKNVLVIGKMGSGKDTVAIILRKLYGYNHRAIAGRLKQVAKTLYPGVFNTGDKNERRRLLQHLGDVLRADNQNVFNDALHYEIETESLGPVAISDVRYRMEYDYFVEKGYVPIRIHVDDAVRFERLRLRDGINPSLETQAHKSENDLVEDRTRECIVVNNNRSFEELERQLALLEDKLGTKENELVNEVRSREQYSLGANLA